MSDLICLVACEVAGEGGRWEMGFGGGAGGLDSRQLKLKTK